MNLKYRNKNRGYQQLMVWQDAIELYGLACKAVKNWPFEMKRIASQTIASSDSIHRNIAEGYCRRSIKEYLNHLNIAIGSIGETLSGFIAYARNDQITKSEFEEIDQLVVRLENRMLKLIESLQRKRDDGDWDDFFVKESMGSESEIDNDLALFELNIDTSATA